VHVIAKMFQTAKLVERKACCHVANAFLSRLEPLWLISRLKMYKMSKTAFLPKAPGVDWLKYVILINKKGPHPFHLSHLIRIRACMYLRT